MLRMRELSTTSELTLMLPSTTALPLAYPAYGWEGGAPESGGGAVRYEAAFTLDTGRAPHFDMTPKPHQIHSPARPEMKKMEIIYIHLNK